MTKPKLIVILGPTGIGKTDITIALAKKFDSEIISADSRQFFKELKIGTAAPSEEQLNEVKHHLIGNISIFDYYSVFRFEEDVLSILSEIWKNKNLAFMTGGSGLYIDAVCNGIDDIPDADPEIRIQVAEKYNIEGLEGLRFELKRLDPDYYMKVDLKNPKRIMRAIEVCLTTGNPFSSFHTEIKKERDFDIVKIGLETERDVLYNRIDKRVESMMESGLLEEAEKYFKYQHLNSLNTVGYKELFEYFDKKISLDKAVELIKRNSRRYAKRQMSWFKRDTSVNWFNTSDSDRIEEFIKIFIG